MEKVQLRDEIRLIPAYDSPPAEEMPMFAENRVHQRSSGNPYPNRVVMEVDRQHRQERPFRVITLENEYLRVELLPQLGGKIHSALDKRTGYDFFYKQHVIKPALIGMLGSWVSGGCEFNWPCHHRPSTFMPTDVAVEEEENGAVTVWMGEHEPLDRMKGMVGVRLAPGEARLDTRMKVFNRTPHRHSFLWWENAAVPVNENYRLVFPPDVGYVQFHYRKNVAGYPLASGVYNGIRMGEGTDISYHKNTRQPTSYFCAETEYDFFGGYDEEKKRGVIHVADHTTSPGKKMFTWAYSQLSRSWEKALTDTDGPYAELMAGSYSLNQPDFAWLAPYEGREFSQMWYPVGEIGLPLCACREAAAALENGKLLLQPTIPLRGYSLDILENTFPVNGTPDDILSFPIPQGVSAFTLKDEKGRPVMRCQAPDPRHAAQMPETIPDNPTLDALSSAQEAWLMGVHAEQYRDPTIRPNAYWQEALRREPENLPALTRLGEYELTHLRPREALGLLRRAWNTVTRRNFHPESGEIQYLTGRALEMLDRDGEAWEWYMQSAWAQDTRSRALTRAAMIRGRQGDWDAMAALAGQALEAQGSNQRARLLQALALGHTDPARAKEAREALKAGDPLHFLCRLLEEGPENAFAALGSDGAQRALDWAETLWEAGERALAAQALAALPEKCAQTEYVRAYLTGDEAPLARAASLPVGIAYPSRELEARALGWAVEKNPRDAAALLLLGCILYAKENYEQADELWARAHQADPGACMPLRNMAVARYSHLNRRQEALPLLKEALALRPRDGQLVWETALVMARTGMPPLETAAFLEEKNVLREDVIIELCRAYNAGGAWEKALALLNSTPFTPCEGGEHAVAEQYMFAHHALGRAALKEGRVRDALARFEAAQKLPDRLGAGLWNEVLLVPHQYFQALCLQRLGREKEGEEILRHILCLKQDYFSDMHLPELPCWQALAWRALGQEAPARELIAAHLRRQDAAEGARDAGYYAATPFFISYMESPAVQRRGAVHWQRAMAHFAAGNEDIAREEAAQALRDRPELLYARLL